MIKHDKLQALVKQLYATFNELEAMYRSVLEERRILLSSA